MPLNESCYSGGTRFPHSGFYTYQLHRELHCIIAFVWEKPFKIKTDFLIKMAAIPFVTHCIYALNAFLLRSLPKLKPTMETIFVKMQTNMCFRFERSNGAYDLVLSF